MVTPNLRRLGTIALRYGAVGASVNGTGYLAYLALTWDWLSPRLAVTVLFPISLWAAYQLHSRVTFVGSVRDGRSALRFLVISLAGYVLNLAILTLLVDRGDFPHQIAQLVSIVFIALLMFHLTRTTVFVGSSEEGSRPTA